MQDHKLKFIFTFSENKNTAAGSFWKLQRLGFYDCHAYIKNDRCIHQIHDFNLCSWCRAYETA